MFDIEQIIARHAVLESERSNFDAIFQEVAELALPRAAHFQGANMTPGQERTRMLMDSYGVQALDRGVTVMEGLVMPQGALWMALGPDDPELLRDQRVAEWYERKTAMLFALRSERQSGFVTQAHDSVASLLAFGNQSMWVDMRFDAFGAPEGLRYVSEHIGSITIEEDYQGQVTRSTRTMRMKARDALKKFGRAALNMAPAILKAATDPKEETREFQILHCVMPNPRLIEGNLDWRGKPFTGLYISVEDKTAFDVGGYRSMPRIYSRYETAGNESYGRGPGVSALPELRQMQDVMADIMVAAELQAMPPLAAVNDLNDQMIQYSANGITYGAIDDMGRRMIAPLLEQTGDLTQMQALLQYLHERVDRFFLNDVLITNQEIKSHVSATEIAERRAEAGMLLSPLARQEGEWFIPMLDRELDLMDQLGAFDDMPDVVAEAGGIMQVRFDNQLTKLREGDRAAGLFRTAEQVGSIAAFYPNAGQEFAAAFPLAKWLPALADLNAVPASWRASEDEQAAEIDAQQQQAQIAQLTELLPALGRTERDLAVANNAGK